MLIKAGDVNVTGTIDSVLVFDKLGRTEVESAEAGDIVAVVGLAASTSATPSPTSSSPVALPRIEVDEPTLSMLFTVNDSPLTGEGQYLTSRHLKERLDRELQSNVALRVEPTDERDSFIVSGRGLLAPVGPDRDDAPRRATSWPSASPRSSSKRSTASSTSPTNTWSSTSRTARWAR